MKNIHRVVAILFCLGMTFLCIASSEQRLCPVYSGPGSEEINKQLLAQYIQSLSNKGMLRGGGAASASATDYQSNSARFNEQQDTLYETCVGSGALAEWLTQNRVQQYKNIPEEVVSLLSQFLCVQNEQVLLFNKLLAGIDSICGKSEDVKQKFVEECAEIKNYYNLFDVLFQNNLNRMPYLKDFFLKYNIVLDAYEGYKKNNASEYVDLGTYLQLFETACESKHQRACIISMRPNDIENICKSEALHNLIKYSPDLKSAIAQRRRRDLLVAKRCRVSVSSDHVNNESNEQLQVSHRTGAGSGALAGLTDASTKKYKVSQCNNIPKEYVNKLISFCEIRNERMPVFNRLLKDIDQACEKTDIRTRFLKQCDLVISQNIDSSPEVYLQSITEQVDLVADLFLKYITFVKSYKEYERNKHNTQKDCLEGIGLELYVNSFEKCFKNSCNNVYIVGGITVSDIESIVSSDEFIQDLHAREKEYIQQKERHARALTLESEEREISDIDAQVRELKHLYFQNIQKINRDNRKEQNQIERLVRIQDKLDSCQEDERSKRYQINLEQDSEFKAVERFGQKNKANILKERKEQEVRSFCKYEENERQVVVDGYKEGYKELQRFDLDIIEKIVREKLAQEQLYEAFNKVNNVGIKTGIVPTALRTLIRNCIKFGKALVAQDSNQDFIEFYSREEQAVDQNKQASYDVLLTQLQRIQKKNKEAIRVSNAGAGAMATVVIEQRKRQQERIRLEQRVNLQEDETRVRALHQEEEKRSRDALNQDKKNEANIMEALVIITADTHRAQIDIQREECQFRERLKQEFEQEKEAIVLLNELEQARKEYQSCMKEFEELDAFEDIFNPEKCCFNNTTRVYNAQEELSTVGSTVENSAIKDKEEIESFVKDNNVDVKRQKNFMFRGGGRGADAVSVSVTEPIEDVYTIRPCGLRNCCSCNPAVLGSDIIDCSVNKDTIHFERQVGRRGVDEGSLEVEQIVDKQHIGNTTQNQGLSSNHSENLHKAFAQAGNIVQSFTSQVPQSGGRGAQGNVGREVDQSLRGRGAQGNGGRGAQSLRGRGMRGKGW